MTTQDKRFAAIVFAVPILLLIPFLAMQFSYDVNWSGFDFIAAGVLLLMAGSICEFMLRRVSKFGSRIAFGALIFAALLLVWAELAVGIFGTPFAGS